MFDKILIANRGVNTRQRVSTPSQGLACAARTGDLAAEH